MRRAIGVPCPGCGFTRATGLVLHGHLAEATSMYPLWFVVAPLLVFVLVKDALTYVKTGKWGATATGPRARWVTITVIALLFVVWIARFFGAFGGPAPV